MPFIIKNMSVNEYCIGIIALLSDVGENNWIHSFKDFVTELEKHEDTAVYRKIISIYSGAGSFNDLVLYKDGKICIEENNKLALLRSGLYNQIADKWN